MNSWRLRISDELLPLLNCPISVGCVVFPYDVKDEAFHVDKCATRSAGHISELGRWNDLSIPP